MTTVFVARSTYHRSTNVAQQVAVSVCEPWTKVLVVMLHYYTPQVKPQAVMYV